MRENNIVELLQNLIRIPTVNPPCDTRECANYLLDMFRRERIDAEIVEPVEKKSNVVARLKGKRPGKIILLNGHLDVVPPGENWTVDPFGGELDNGRVFGRGACDMKSGIAAMTCSMINFARSSAGFDGEIIFMAVADEETGSEFGTLHLLRKMIGVEADFAIVTEPTTLKVELGNRGLRWIDISLRGKASHAGRPHLGVNAVVYGAKIVEAIQSLGFSKRDDFFEIPTPSISVTMINGGTKVNVIPERCDISVDRRMIPGETADMALEEIETVVAPILSQESELAAEIRMRSGGWDPFVISEREPLAKAAMESVKKITHKMPVIQGKAACTDASHLFHVGGIPTILFGPGNETRSHKADEFLETDNLVAATRVLENLFGKLLK